MMDTFEQHCTLTLETLVGLAWRFANQEEEDDDEVAALLVSNKKPWICCFQSTIRFSAAVGPTTQQATTLLPITGS
jgi:hypothetical protein